MTRSSLHPFYSILSTLRTGMNRIREHILFCLLFVHLFIPLMFNTNHDISFNVFRSTISNLLPLEGIQSPYPFRRYSSSSLPVLPPSGLFESTPYRVRIPFLSFPFSDLYSYSNPLFFLTSSHTFPSSHVAPL